jgi:hypothetical protein
MGFLLVSSLPVQGVSRSFKAEEHRFNRSVGGRWDWQPIRPCANWLIKYALWGWVARPVMLFNFGSDIKQTLKPFPGVWPGWISQT